DEGVGRVRDARGLRLQPVHRSGRLGAAEEAGARLGAVRVGRVALGGVAAAAVGTVTAGTGGTHDHAITRREPAYRRTGLEYLADGFVPEDGTRRHTGHGAAHQVQIR